MLTDALGRAAGSMGAGGVFTKKERFSLSIPPKLRGLRLLSIPAGGVVAGGGVIGVPKHTGLVLAYLLRYKA